MGRASLEAVDLKLKRAQDRLGSLTDAANEFLSEPDNHTVAMEDHPHPPGFILRVKEVRSPPPEIGILIGECVQHYRSALDYLAFQLLVANRTGHIPAKLIKRSEFPISNSGPKFRGRFNRKGEPLGGSGWAKLAGVGSEAATVIERLQPYHRRKNPGSRVLWQLQELSNIDKHRLLHVTHGGQRGSAMTVIKHRNVARLDGPGFIPGPFKRGAVIAEYKIIPIDPRYGAHVDMNPELLTHIVFGKGSAARSVRGLSVLPVLSSIGDFIASDVLPPLCAVLGLQSAFKPGRLIDGFELSPSEREAAGGYVGPEITIESDVKSQR
jgi:hypothetical protein